jgi:signal transduction histidine kinase
VEVVTDVPENIVLPLDAQRFQEALLNLIINAIHAITPPGTITVSARPSPSTGYVVLKISDTGAGIPKEYLGRIFDPFFTLKESGTGLGLSVVFGVIKKHGGMVSVDSEAGQGTCFTIHLPLGERPEVCA